MDQINEFKNETRFILNYQTNIFHLFDGYLNKNFGGSHKKNMEKLQELIITDHLYSNLKEYALNEVDFKYDPLTLFSLSKNPELPRDDIKKTLSFIISQTRKFFLENIEQYKSTLQYTKDILFSFGTSQHAMCLLIIQKNSQYYLIIVNSGDGINYHGNTYNNKNILWNSYKIINLIKLPDILLHIFGYIPYLKYIRNIINKFKRTLTDKQPSDEKYKNAYIELIDLFNDHIITIYKDFNNKELLKINNDIEHNDELVLIYTSLSDLVDLGNLEKVNCMDIFSQESFDDFNGKWNQKRDEELQSYEKLFYTRNDFELNNNQLYTQPQQSGTCSWFSLYWSFFAIKLIKVDHDLFDFLDLLTKQLHLNLKDLFLKTNFKKLNLVSGQINKYIIGQDFSRYKQEYLQLISYIRLFKLYNITDDEYYYSDIPQTFMFGANLRLYIPDERIEEKINIDYYWIINKFNSIDEEIKKSTIIDQDKKIHNKIMLILVNELLKYNDKYRLNKVELFVFITNILALLIKLQNKGRIITIQFPEDEITNDKCFIRSSMFIIDITKYEFQLINLYLSNILLFRDNKLKKFVNKTIIIENIYNHIDETQIKDLINGDSNISYNDIKKNEFGKCFIKKYLIDYEFYYYPRDCQELSEMSLVKKLKININLVSTHKWLNYSSIYKSYDFKNIDYLTKINLEIINQRYIEDKLYHEERKLDIIRREFDEIYRQVKNKANISSLDLDSVIESKIKNLKTKNKDLVEKFEEIKQKLTKATEHFNKMKYNINNLKANECMVLQTINNAIFYGHLLDDKKRKIIIKKIINIIKIIDINKPKTLVGLTNYKQLIQQITILLLIYILYNVFIKMDRIGHTYFAMLDFKNLIVAKKYENVKTVKLTEEIILSLHNLLIEQEYNIELFLRTIYSSIRVSKPIHDSYGATLQKFIDTYSITESIEDNETVYTYKKKKFRLVYKITSFDNDFNKLLLGPLLNNNEHTIYLMSHDRLYGLIYSNMEYIKNKIMDNNLLVEIVKSDSSYYSSVSFKINDYDVILKQNNFPFINFLPITSSYLVLKKENHYKVLLWDFPWRNIQEFKNDLIFNTTTAIKDPILIELHVKNNLLYYEIDSNTYKLLSILYNENGLPISLYNMYKDDIIFKTKINSNETVNTIGLINIRSFLNVYSKLKIDNIRTLLKTEIEIDESVNKNYNLFDLTELLNVYKDIGVDPNIEKVNSIPLADINDNTKIIFNKKIKKCLLQCDIVKSKQENIERIIRYKNRDIIRSLDTLIGQLNLNDIDFMLILKNNASVLLQIIQLNIYISNLYKLKKILLSCNELTCRDFVEINELLNFNLPISTISTRKKYYTKNKKFSFTIIDNQVGGALQKVYFSDIFFQIVFGYMVRKEQWETYNNIITNYKNRETINQKIYQLMMGKGKSSVITPLLYLYLYSVGEKDKINIVLPDNLINQANTDNFIFQKLFHIPIEIYDINIAKINYLKGENGNEPNMILKKPNEIFIFDEFDSMYDPITSNFNFIIEADKKISILTFITVFNLIQDKTLEDIIHLIETKNLHRDTPKYKLKIQKIKEEVDIIKKEIKDGKIHKNLHYGMDYSSDNKNHHVVPYIRKDTPLKKSKFSSILRTIVLTIQYYKYNNYKLEENDLLHIYNNKNYSIFPNSEQIQQLFKKKFNEFVEKIYTDEYVSGDNITVLFLQYMEYYIIKSIRISNSIYNLSFLEIIGNHDDAWKVGYTGTVNMDLPQYTSDERGLFDSIEYDQDEKINVYFAITGEIDTTKNFLINKSDKDPLDDVITKLLLKKYQCLIDISAYLKDYSNIDVIQKIQEKSNDNDKYYWDKKFVYLDENDQKLIKYKSDESYPYKNELFTTDEVFYYYSQKNTVGIDFKQPTQLYGLVIIDDNNNYTQVAQGIYRLRKLNVGHKFDILYTGSNDTMTQKKLYKQLVEKDNETRINKKNLLDLMNLKYLVRRMNPQIENYIENNIVPYFQIQNDVTQEYLIDRLQNNIQNISEFIRIEPIKTLYNNLTKNVTILKSVLLDITKNTVDNEQQMELQQQQQQQVHVEVSSEIQKSILLEEQYLRIFGNSIIFFPSEIDIEIIKLCCINIDDKLYASYNIFLPKLYSNEEKLFIIKLSNDFYLLERNDIYHYYYHRYPIFNLDGERLNPKLKEIPSFTINHSYNNDLNILKLEYNTVAGSNKYYYNKYLKYKYKYFCLRNNSKNMLGSGGSLEKYIQTNIYIKFINNIILTPENYTIITENYTTHENLKYILMYLLYLNIINISQLSNLSTTKYLIKYDDYNSFNGGLFINSYYSSLLLDSLWNNYIKNKNNIEKLHKHNILYKFYNLEEKLIYIETNINTKLINSEIFYNDKQVKIILFETIAIKYLQNNFPILIKYSELYPSKTENEIIIYLINKKNINKESAKRLLLEKFNNITNNEYESPPYDKAWYENLFKIYSDLIKEDMVEILRSKGIAIESDIEREIELRKFNKNIGEPQKLFRILDDIKNLTKISDLNFDTFNTFDNYKSLMPSQKNKIPDTIIENVIIANIAEKYDINESKAREFVKNYIKKKLRTDNIKRIYIDLYRELYQKILNIES